MKRLFLFTAFISITMLSSLSAQMVNGIDTLYGNEWINTAQTYYKIPVITDGIYKFTYQSLVDAGIPASALSGNQFQVIHMGEEIPIHTSTDGAFNSNEYLEFYGEKNRSALDTYLWDNPELEIMNPEHSLFTDTSSYFLTWNNGTNNDRMQIVTNNISNPPPADPFYEHEEMSVQTNKFFKEPFNSQGAFKSNYLAGEGFCSTVAVSNSVTLEATNIQSQNNASVFVQGVTKSGGHQIQMTINGTEYFNETLNGSVIFRQNFDLADSDFAASNTVTVQGLNGNLDKHGISIVKLKYRRNFDFDNQNQFIFNVASSGNDKFLEIDNFDAGGQNPILYDITNNIRIETTLSANQVKVKIPGSATERKMILYNPTSGVNLSTTMAPFTPIDFNQTEGEFIIITNERLFDDGSGNNYIQEYANYRASAQGGGFNTKIVEIQDLYDHFAYGVHRHPLSIRNFTHYIEKKWDNPQHVFIIGKGVEYKNTRNNISGRFFIPTFGTPGSDNLLLSTNKTSTPIIPVGRIAAKNGDDVRSYLEKVIARETAQQTPSQTIEDKAWLKRVMQLSGGGANEQATIANHLNALGDVIEEGCLGAEVTTFYKDSSDPIQISVNQQIFDLINSGVSMLTFFGHSSVGAFDFVIDKCENYGNIDKSFVMLSLGCYSGNVHTGLVGIGEDFTFCEDKGAVAFCASSGLAYISPLRAFAEKFYDLTGTTYCAQGIGKILQQTIEYTDANSAGINEMTQQFTLHGDPALLISYTQEPDYLVDESSVSFEPSIVSALLDDFEIKFDVVNIGNNINDSINILVERELSNGQLSTVASYKIAAPGFRKTEVVTIPSLGKESAGLNRFYIKVDSNDEVVENPQPIAENNNELYSSNGERGTTLYIIDDSARPIFPEDYAIINTNSIKLTASTLNSTSTPRNYLMEIDTTQLFNSSLKQSTEIMQGGGIVDWTPNFNYQENTVYYWRVSPDSISTTESYNWQGHSFVYLPNESTGWNQSHYFQYIPDEYYRMKLNEAREFEYEFNLIGITIENTELIPGTGPNFIIDGTNDGEFWWWGGDQHICVTVADPSGQFLLNMPDDPTNNAVNPWGVDVRAFFFETDNITGREDLVNFLNGIPNNHTVFFNTYQNQPTSDYMPQDWALDSLTYGTNIFQVLEGNGASQVRDLESGARPYTFIYNTSTGAEAETIATTNTDLITTDYELEQLVTAGTVTSVPIGPASEWQTMEWNPIYSAIPAEDSISVSIIGVTTTGVDTLLFSNLTGTSQSLEDVDADAIPYVKLVFNSRDDISRTTAQIDYWRVLYRSLPDAAINPNKFFFCNQDTLQQGESFELKVAVENPSALDMDSLLVKYTFKDQSNNEVTVFNRNKPLLKGDTLVTNLEFMTGGLDGLLNFSMELNPNEDQPELYQFNNYLIKQLYVNQDNENPILDVTFDGYHILDGDIVSPAPLITIQLNDENEYLTLSDTSLFNIFLNYPSGLTQNISFMDDFVTFYPATEASANKAVIELRPTFLEEGLYQLIVQAEDVTGNQSGSIDYKVQFEVITKKAISNILNYPNPFSTSTQFVYTLTGDEVPEYFKIQVLNVSGRIVKEITQDEMGPLKVGRNKSEYRWDGTDTYGNRLANGVYLYRIVAKNAMGEDFEKIQTGADKFFKRGFGKMVILR